MDRKESVFEEIQEEHLDNMIKLALKQAEAEGLLDNDSFDDEPITEEEVQRTYELFLQKWDNISKQRIKNEKKQRVKNIIRLGTRALVCIVLCLIIAAPIAIASIAPVRDYVTKMLINIKADHAEIELSIISNNSIPDDWNGRYYPLYIPERYHLAKTVAIPVTAVFMDADNNVLYFTEGDQNEGIDIDSENAIIRYERVGTNDVLIVEKEEYITFVWNNDERLFTISGIMSIDEARNMMNSTIRVD